MGFKINAGNTDNLVNPYDIFCMQETWFIRVNKSHNPRLSPLRWLAQQEKTKRQELRIGNNSIQTFRTSWANKAGKPVKLDKKFFWGLNADIHVYLCNTYLAPRDSPYVNQQDTDVIGILMDGINSYLAQGDIILIGDFNSRVSECYQSLTAHQHQKGHTMPKQVIMISTSIQVATVLRTALCESIRYQAKSEQNVR